MIRNFVPNGFGSWYEYNRHEELKAQRLAKVKRLALVFFTALASASLLAVWVLAYFLYTQGA